MTCLAYIILLQGTPVEGFTFNIIYIGVVPRNTKHIIIIGFDAQIGMIQCFDKAMVLIARREN